MRPRKPRPNDPTIREPGGRPPCPPRPPPLKARVVKHPSLWGMLVPIIILALVGTLAMAVIDLYAPSILEPRGGGAHYWHDPSTGVCWVRLGEDKIGGADDKLVECNADIIAKATAVKSYDP